METQSLSSLGEEVRKLSQAVGRAGTQLQYMQGTMGIGFTVLALVLAFTD